MAGPRASDGRSTAGRPGPGSQRWAGACSRSGCTGVYWRVPEEGPAPRPLPLPVGTALGSPPPPPRGHGVLLLRQLYVGVMGILDAFTFGTLYTLHFYIFTFCTSHFTLYALHSAVSFSPPSFVPHAHWEAYGCGSLPLHNLLSAPAHPHNMSNLMFSNKQKKFSLRGGLSVHLCVSGGRDRSRVVRVGTATSLQHLRVGTATSLQLLMILAATRHACCEPKDQSPV